MFKGNGAMVIIPVMSATRKRYKQKDINEATRRFTKVSINLRESSRDFVDNLMRGSK